MPRKPSGKPVGRPHRDFDYRIFEELCFIDCTVNEIESVLNTDQRTLNEWCIRHYGADFSTCYKKYGENGKASLRRSQMRAAAKGNATLLIWLGKTRLGQKDPEKQQDVYITNEALHDFMNKTRDPVAKPKADMQLPDIEY